MPYPSVDELQKTLAQNVFNYTKDAKKAAGRALGTLVEIISFYTLKSWGFERSIAIETPVPEYMNHKITHNVEYSIHPSNEIERIELPCDDLPFTAKKIIKKCETLKRQTINDVKTNQLLTKNLILRNSCTICTVPDGFINAYIKSEVRESFPISLHMLTAHPYAIVECKRVGVEEGMRKGPQTIEKAKQGAYVAKSVSSLQKIRYNNGTLGGIIHLPDGTLYSDEFPVILEKIINCNEKKYLQHFVLTIGVVSNHGNWFTGENHNKELIVLAQSYDWLTFLTDTGLAQFINDLLQHPINKYEPIKQAFLESYTGEKQKNKFTKVQLALDADLALQEYFQENRTQIESWFNIISPRDKSLTELRNEIALLANKDWRTILQ